MDSNNPDTWAFHLFVSEKSSDTDRAVALLEQICQQYLEGKCQIKVVDIRENPVSAVELNIIATPTLLKRHMGCEKRIIGSISDKDKLLSRLGIEMGG